MKSRKCFKFTGGEPFFDGHFPGAPILPGVMQLQLACEAAAEMHGEKRVLKAVKKMKFTKTIEPGEEIVLEIEGEDEVVYRFLKKGEPCSSGVLVY